jgi:hypothetical protein
MTSDLTSIYQDSENHSIDDHIRKFDSFVSHLTNMKRNCLLFFIILSFTIGIGTAQTFVKTSDIFQRSGNNSKEGHLIIIQDPALDTLISRYILGNKNQEEKIGYPSIAGFRIQIYNRMDLNAKVESSNVEIEFKTQFPDIASYRLFEEPRWYKVRVGNFRSRTEAIKLYLIISKKFPDSDIVPDDINLNDLKIK